MEQMPPNEQSNICFSFCKENTNCFFFITDKKRMQINLQYITSLHSPKWSFNFAEGHILEQTKAILKSKLYG